MTEPQGARDHERRAQEREGGDAACWAHRVCQQCGRLNDAEHPVVCENCGVQFDENR